MSRWFFILREGIGAFGRSGISGWLAIFSFAVLSFMVITIMVAEQTLENGREQLRSLFELELFLKPHAESEARTLQEWIMAREGVSGTEYVSREQAAQRFSEEFGGELFSLLEENPLPASIIVRYNPEFVTPEFLEAEVEDFSELEELDEIVYEGDLLERMEQIAETVRIRVLIAGLIIAVVTIFFTSQSIRAAGKASRLWVRTLALIGGTESQVKAPFLVSGLLAGLTGGLAGVGLSLLLQTILATQNGIFPTPELLFPLIVLGSCCISGAIIAGIFAPRMGVK